ncbi:MAG: DEAD/DEAH box helicase family protein [Chloracidobacterium sp.]|nr:DEAD/DEAH box helicase family protein [Chloracidobacterium sp.]
MPEFKLPSLFAINALVNGNAVQQLHLPPDKIVGTRIRYTLNSLRGALVVPEGASETERILVLSKVSPHEVIFERVLIVPKTSTAQAEEDDFSQCRWNKHPLLDSPVTAGEKRVEEVLESWRGTFAFVQERLDNELIPQQGLREPQIGALHAIHAHWSVSTAAATIVMPTGTGKTETMLSVLISAICSKVLIVVPTDALRNQIANKFLTLGLLKTMGVVSQSALSQLSVC